MFPPVLAKVEKEQGPGWNGELHAVDPAAQRKIASLFASGEAVLMATWSKTKINNSEKDAVSYQFAGAEPLEEDGYAALVASEKELLRKLAANIAAELQ